MNTAVDGTSPVVPATDEHRTRPIPSRRRDKPQLSCNLCRRRKLRCDRQYPCSTCAARGYTCTYADNVSTSASSGSQFATPSTNINMQNRLAELERLVLQLMPDPSHRERDLSATENFVGPQASGLPYQDRASSDAVSERRSEAGSMRINASEHRYVGGEHWIAIVDSIADLRDHFDREEQLALVDFPSNDMLEEDGSVQNPESPSSRHALLLYSGEPPVTRDELLSALPPKAAVDRYIARYFNLQDLVSGSIHGPTFLRQYEEFWTKPAGVPIMWIGLLFGMICLAAMMPDSPDARSGVFGEQQKQVLDLYRRRIVQCLIAGRYTKSGPHVLETIIHYIYIEFAMRADAGNDIPFLLGLEVNLAIRMGYHRDPSNFQGISPLQGEMRRRLWATVLLGDVLISTQMGMQRMVSDWQCDTAEPCNLNDADLHEGLTELPPPRPETEITTTLGMIARTRLLKAMGAVLDLTASAKSCAYAEVIRVDRLLHEAIASIPAPLRMKSMAASITDAPQVIMARVFLSILFQQAKNMLHRRFLYADSPSESEDIFSYSRTACLDATLEMLRVQQTLDEETGYGGQLHMMRWRLSSIVNHQFLTATMILCSVLYRGKWQNRKEEIIEALRNSRRIWIQNSAISREAHKAAEIVGRALAHAGDVRGQFPNISAVQAGRTGDGQEILSGSAPPTSEDGLDMNFDDQTNLQSPGGLFESDPFVLSALSGSFGPPFTHRNDLNVTLNQPKTGLGSGEWMALDEQGTSWW